MANTIAFFPWVQSDEKTSVGPIRLLPYSYGKLPGDQPHISQKDIDGVLSAFAIRPGHRVKRATLLEIDDWHSGMDANEKITEALFRIRNFLGFSALSTRRLFRSVSNYSNFDQFALVVQRYQPGQAGTFSFNTRRRDGNGIHLWSSDDFAFIRPNHVDETRFVHFDEQLLIGLLHHAKKRNGLYEAIAEFNSANTDSPDIPPHVEVVMCKSSFEWVLEIDEKANNFIAALGAKLKEIPMVQRDGPQKEKWEKRYQHSNRLLDAWVRDFCNVRGSSAHGKDRKASKFIWQPHQHLAFIAFFFPLLLKKILADEGILQFERVDLEKLSRIDQYLAYDPFDFRWNEGKRHPWDLIDSAAARAASRI